MDRALRAHVREEVAAADLEPEAVRLVLAACDGAEALDAALSGEPCADATEPAGATQGRELWLTSLTVEGIRGIRGPLTITLDPEPGLVIVAGRNGAGKSSLAEGLEALLLGKADRWKTRGSSFGAGWQNVHHAGGVRRVCATFRVAGDPRPLQVERRWTGADPSRSELLVDGAPAGDVDAWGGRALVAAWCPLLSCGLVARTLEDDRPSEAFDALALVVGLDALHEAADLLRVRSRARAEEARASDARLAELRAVLAGHPDPRASRCATLMAAGGEPELEALRAVLAERGDDDALRDLARLRRVAGAEIPDDVDVDRVAADLRAAADAVREHAGPAVAEGEHLARLLDSALHLHERGARACPVCGAPDALGGDWARAARERAEVATAGIRRLREARQALEDAEARARSFVDDVHRRVDSTFLTPEEQAAIVAWRAGGSSGGEALARHLDRHWPAVGGALRAARERAAARLDALQQAWLPLARQVAEWVSTRADAIRGRAQAAHLLAAGSWLQAEEGELRRARFAPIRDFSLRIWQRLRQESSVDLLDLAIEGVRTRRRLELTADLDGVEAPALRVASQGELNALTLSVFVPRAALDESPFRFVLIDDPIQAMDAYRIDGLAQVLGELARDRQTIVLTHDERLLESLRCQQISARVVAVRRQRRSQVAVEDRRDPIEQHLGDAEKVLSAGRLAEDVRAALVLGFCREAVEAAFLRRIRRRSLAEGDGSSHDDLEEALADRTLRDLGGLALHEHRRRGGKELDETLLRGTGRADLAQLLDTLNQGAHGTLPPGVRPAAVVEQSRALARFVLGTG